MKHKILTYETANLVGNLNTIIQEKNIKKKDIVNVETLQGSSSFNTGLRLWYWKTVE